MTKILVLVPKDIVAKLDFSKSKRVRIDGEVSHPGKWPIDGQPNVRLITSSDHAIGFGERSREWFIN
nr:hypothetical protein [Allorhodopirellula heiligendammensis]